jgi:NAD(P)-dependent dehydrogenase (short-subunit alcohol dehydrogenase family)
MSRILVTGASKGIGRQIAAELARRGHHVVATARNPRTLDDLAVAQTLRLDVTDQASVDAAIRAAGPVDVLVSNAGEIILASVEDSPVPEIERLFDVNAIGAIRVTQAVIPVMREIGGGRLVYMSSVAGRAALPMIGAYASSKWALEAIAETLAIEVRRFGIVVNVVEPGAVDSGALDDPPTYAGSGRYLDLAAQTAIAGTMLSVDAVARATADVIDDGDPRLRIPVGGAAEMLTAAANDWPADRPFEPVPYNW